jgi:chromosome segregation ATPase
MAEILTNEQLEILHSSEKLEEQEQKDRQSDDNGNGNISFLLETVEVQQKELGRLRSSLKDLNSLIEDKIGSLSQHIQLRQEDCTLIAKRIQNEDDEKRIQSEFWAKKLSVLSDRNLDLEQKNSQLKKKNDELEQVRQLSLEDLGLKSKQITQLETEKQKWLDELKNSKSLLSQTTNKLETNHGQIERLQKQLQEEKSLAKHLQNENQSLQTRLEDGKLENISLQNSFYSELKSVSDRLNQIETEKQGLQKQFQEANNWLEKMKLENQNLQTTLEANKETQELAQKEYEQTIANLKIGLDTAAKEINRYKSRINLTKLQVLLAIALIAATSIGIFTLLAPAYNGNRPLIQQPLHK